MPKSKCFVCNKKLSLVEETAGLCKCDNVFCVKHKIVGTDPKQESCHICTFNYSIKHKELLKKNNPVLVGNKGLQTF